MLRSFRVGRHCSLYPHRTRSGGNDAVDRRSAGAPGERSRGRPDFAGTGYYSKTSSHGGREVTLIEIETIEALFRSVLGADGGRLGIKLAAADTRRNIATSGVPLNHLVDCEFCVGTVLMRGTRLCEPCEYLEELTQHGVMSGLIHRGGLRAQILSEGVIRIGDSVRPKALV
jgi:MOSC domain-containing protein YiiM